VLSIHAASSLKLLHELLLLLLVVVVVLLLLQVCGCGADNAHQQQQLPTAHQHQPAGCSTAALAGWPQAAICSPVWCCRA
jgi:hypothetical protein